MNAMLMSARRALFRSLHLLSPQEEKNLNGTAVEVLFLLTVGGRDCSLRGLIRQHDAARRPGFTIDAQALGASVDPLSSRRANVRIPVLGICVMTLLLARFGRRLPHRTYALFWGFAFATAMFTSDERCFELDFLIFGAHESEALPNA